MFKNLTAVLQFSWTPKWLELSSGGASSMEQEFLSLLVSFKDVKVALYDSQPWHPTIARFAVCDFEELASYREFYERLMRSQLHQQNFIKVTDIALGADRPFDNLMKPDGQDYCALVKLSLTDRWFELASQEKSSLGDEFGGVIDRWGERIDLRWLDSEAWTTGYSDFILVGFSALDEYNEFWHQVRGHPYFSGAYFRFRGTVLGAKQQVEITTLST